MRKHAIIIITLILLIGGGGWMFHDHLQRGPIGRDYVKIDRFLRESSLPEGWKLHGPPQDSRFKVRLGPKWLETLGIRPKQDLLRTDYGFILMPPRTQPFWMPPSQPQSPPRVMAVGVNRKSGRVSGVLISGRSRDVEMMKKFLLEKDPSLQSILTCYPF